MSDQSKPALAARVPRYELIYFILGNIFVTSLVLTNIIGTKLFYAFPTLLPNGFFGDGPVTLTAGIITYPITFLVTDVVSEVYGRKRADLLVYTGFLMSMFMLVIVQIAIALIPSPVWLNEHSKELGLGTLELVQAGYASVFYLPGILLFASMTAYMVAQLLDVRLFHFWKRVTKGKYLWLRNNASTGVSQLVDTIIVNSIFLTIAFGLPVGVVTQIIIANYLFKMLFAAVDTPFIYLGVYLTKKGLGKKFHEEVEHPPVTPAAG